MSYEDYASATFDGVITRVQFITLSEYIDEAYHGSFTRFDKAGETRKLDKEHMILHYEVDGSEKEFIVGVNPSSRGSYAMSNVKKLIDANGLPLDTGKWAGLKVQCKLDQKGYPTVAL